MNRKTKICKRCGKKDYIHSYDMCANCRNIMYAKWDHKRPTRTFKEFMTQDLPIGTDGINLIKKPVKRKKSERTLAMNRADQWFSRYIRLKHSIVGEDKSLYCKCYTCGNLKPIKKIDNGHWIGRENMQVRYNENNCRPQCVHCNHYKGGRHSQFEQFLINDIGSDNVDKIKAISIIRIPVSALQLRETAKYYREKVKEIQNQLNLKHW